MVDRFEREARDARLNELNIYTIICSINFDIKYKRNGDDYGYYQNVAYRQQCK